jgi:hypothetical protein
MAGRFAVFDTLTDRDIGEFDDLPAAYAEIDRLKQRHGVRRYAVRPAKERRERVRAPKVPALNGLEAAPGILEAIMHLATVVEQLIREIDEIKALLRREIGRAPDIGFPARGAAETSSELDRSVPVAKPSKAKLAASEGAIASRAERDDTVSKLSSELRKLFLEISTENSTDKMELESRETKTSKPNQSKLPPGLTTRDAIISAYRSGDLTRAQAIEALGDSSIE